jgi:hypothetical protein
VGVSVRRIVGRSGLLAGISNCLVCRVQESVLWNGMWRMWRVRYGAVVGKADFLRRRAAFRNCCWVMCNGSWGGGAKGA